MTTYNLNKEESLIIERHRTKEKTRMTEQKLGLQLLTVALQYMKWLKNRRSSTEAIREFASVTNHLFEFEIDTRDQNGYDIMLGILELVDFSLKITRSLGS
jgi:hypothetical protein